jgi:hypothetical protein
MVTVAERLKVAPISTQTLPIPIITEEEKIQGETEMTLEQFLDHFKKVARRFYWIVRDDQLMGHRSRLYRWLPLRAFCPVTAVVYILTGTYYSPGCYELAAQTINLSRNNATKVADATDGITTGCLRSNLLNISNHCNR